MDSPGAQVCLADRRWPLPCCPASCRPGHNYNTAEYKQRLSARSDVSQVSPGAFREAKRGQRVFFVESVADDASRVGNVFVASMQEGKLGVVMSDTGYQEIAAERRQASWFWKMADATRWSRERRSSRSWSSSATRSVPRMARPSRRTVRRTACRSPNWCWRRASRRVASCCGGSACRSRRSFSR